MCSAESSFFRNKDIRTRDKKKNIIHLPQPLNKRRQSHFKISEVWLVISANVDNNILSTGNKHIKHTYTHSQKSPECRVIAAKSKFKYP